MTTSLLTRIFRTIFRTSTTSEPAAKVKWKEIPPTIHEIPKLSNIPAELLGYQRHEVRRDPGPYYYKNILPDSLPDLPQIRANGLFTYQVRSAFHYQAELTLITWGNREAPIIFRTNCILRAEPENPHDRHAIAILIGGKCCGYIGRDDNQKLAGELRAASIFGDVQCRAEITAGGAAKGKAGNFHLKLDLDFPISVRAADRYSDPAAGV